MRIRTMPLRITDNEEALDVLMTASVSRTEPGHIELAGTSVPTTNGSYGEEVITLTPVEYAQLVAQGIVLVERENYSAIVEMR